MEIVNEYTNINLDMTKPESYINKINELNGSINLLLDEFKKIYVMANMHPSNEEIQQRYQNMNSSIEEIQAKLFSILNNIQVDINELNKKLFELNILIKKEREINREFKLKLGIVEDKNNAASEMISDYKQMYNINYLRNWSLFLSTIICIFAIKSIYKNE